ncbi:MAG: MraY family glycosyltransferase [Candidatus Shapirobacteria bacterium]
MTPQPLVTLILWPLLISFLVSFLVTPLIIRLYHHLKWLEDPRKVKFNKATHTYPVPRGGGIPIFISLLVTSFLLLPLDTHLRGILLGATVLTVVGILDDRFDLNPYFRLLTNLLAAGLVIASGIGIAYISNPFGSLIHLDQPRLNFFLFGENRSLWLLADLFALFWIIFLMNTVNWSKGFDGQLPGITVIAALTIALLSLNFSADVTQWPVTVLAALTAGAYLGFLPFNFYPQKIMPGYGGGSLAGYLLAVLAILSTTKVGTAVVVLGIPLIDALYAITRRILTGRSPVWGDRGHLHHKLLDQWQWSKRKTALFYWIITAILGLLALNLSSQQKLYTMITLALIIGGLFLWFSFFTRSSAPSDRAKPSKI